MTSESAQFEQKLDRPAGPTESNNQNHLLDGNPSKNLDILRDIDKKAKADSSIARKFGAPEIGDTTQHREQRTEGGVTTAFDRHNLFSRIYSALDGHGPQLSARHSTGGRQPDGAQRQRHERRDLHGYRKHIQDQNGGQRDGAHEHGGNEPHHPHGRGDRHEIRRERRRPTERSSEVPEGGSASSTTINGREVTIHYDSGGRATYVKDETGEWDSADGGKTWTRRGDETNVRRGEVSIDENGNYVRTDTDYGVRTTQRPDGSTRREIQTRSGETYVVGTNGNGRVNYFKDRRGEWTSTDGRNWTNSETSETRRGRVSLTEYGEFNFRGERGDRQTARSEHLQGIHEMQRDLTRRYGIQFPPPGRRHDGNVNGVPTREELALLKDILARSPHVNYRGVRMWFIRPDGVSDPQQREEVMGYYQGRDMVIMPGARATLEGFDGMEGTLYHELGHHEQERAHPGEWGSRQDTPQLRELMRRMGWHYDRRHGMLMVDRDGGMWKYNRETNQFEWKRGRRPADGRRTIDPQEMRDRARVTPSTTYNDFPYETHAEGVAMYRYNPTLMAFKAPELYRTLRDWDQRQLDRHYGRGRMMRGVDGTVVPNTRENRERRRRMERSMGIS